MDKLIVNGDEIFKYIDVMKKHLSEFINEVKIMDNMKNELEWESMAQNKAFIFYNAMIKDHLSFASRLIKYVDFLYDFTGAYDDSLNEIKKEFNKLNNKVNSNYEKRPL